MSVSEARAALPALVNRVLSGEEVTITRHGQPVAVMVRPDTLRARRADQALASAERVGALLDRGRTLPLRSRPGLTPERAEEMVSEVAASRSDR
jgi:antitoxin (DNA-binding transcriptional repressor) of toxin-antitoxin stability system